MGTFGLQQMYAKEGPTLEVQGVVLGSVIGQIVHRVRDSDGMDLNDEMVCQRCSNIDGGLQHRLNKGECGRSTR